MSEQTSGTAESARQDLRLAKVAKGQRFVIYGILLNLATIALSAVVGEVGGLLFILAAIVSIMGLHGLASGLGYPVWKEVLLILLTLVPLLGIIALASVNAQATRVLRAAGYKVGLLGASGIGRTG